MMPGDSFNATVSAEMTRLIGMFSCVLVDAATNRSDGFP